MTELRLDWDREHGLASLFLAGDPRCVDAREVGDELVLHYDAEGRCVEVEFLDPESSLPSPEAKPETALRVAFEILAAPAGGDRAG